MHGLLDSKKFPIENGYMYCVYLSRSILTYLEPIDSKIMLVLNVTLFRIAFR